MQVQIKKQLKIELDQNDIIQAVGLYLAQNDIAVSDVNLNEITFVKSPKDGLRASLNITEEQGDVPETEVAVNEQPEPEPVATEQPVATQAVEDAVSRAFVDAGIEGEGEEHVQEQAATVAEPVQPETYEEVAVAPAAEDVRKTLFK